MLGVAAPGFARVQMHASVCRAPGVTRRRAAANAASRFSTEGGLASLRLPSRGVGHAGRSHRPARFRVMAMAKAPKLRPDEILITPKIDPSLQRTDGKPYVPPTLMEIAMEEVELAGGGVKKLLRRVARPLSSLKLAIAELAVIAALCAVGTWVEQNKSYTYYIENYPLERKILGFIDYNFILGLGLDHIFGTWYFLTLLVLLAASLTACSATTQYPMLKVARKWSFLSRKSQFYKLEVAEEVDRGGVRDLSTSLAKRGYQVFTQNGKLYGFKGLVGRLAPIAVHVSLLAVLGGSGISALATNEGSAMIPQGSAVEVQSQLRGNALRMVPQLNGMQVFVNDFDIDAYESGAVSQFYSDLSVRDSEGKELYRKSISVNDPLRYKGVTMYQTDWGLSSVIVRAQGGAFGEEGVDLQLPMASLEGKGDIAGRIWGSFLPTGQDGEKRGISILARDLESAVLYKENGEFAGVRRPDSGKIIEVEGITIVLKDIIGSTGLELKMDPGVPLVYAGYGALIVTTFVSYLSHQQVWALEENGVLYVGGQANRAKLDFEMELDQVLTDLPESAAPN